MSALMDELAAEAAKGGEQGSKDSLQRLTAMAEEAKRLKQEVEDLDVQMKAKNTRLWDIKTKEMVDLMQEAKVPSITVGNETFNLETIYKASIPEDRREEANDWLEKNGAGGIIDNTVIIAFPKDCEKDVRSLRTYVEKKYPKAKSVDVKKMVPWARLTSWFKEEATRRLEVGETRISFPMEMLGASITNIVALASEKKRGGRRQAAD